MYPDDLYYSEEHQWIRTNNNIAVLGITDYAQNELGEVVYVELPEVGREVELNETLCEIESVKSVSPVYTPVSGKIIKVNEDLDNQPDLINSSPYDQGWIVQIKLDDIDEIENLLSAKEYQSHLSKL